MNLPTGLKATLNIRWQQQLALLLATLKTWPWLDTAITLRERFRDDRLGLTAGSLTFTTLISLVPLVTVMLALFSAFPMFASFQVALEKYFLQSLVPDTIAKPVLSALTQFAGKANRLGTLGLLFLLITALALMLTIDRSLNAIWRVRKARPIAQRVLVYWAALTLGPLLLDRPMGPFSPLRTLPTVWPCHSHSSSTKYDHASVKVRRTRIPKNGPAA